MELENFKSNYAQSDLDSFSRDKLLKMISLNHHPVLHRMRTQLMVESLAFAAFLAVYYNFFDGHTRSVTWNLLLVGGVFLILIHNLLGFGAIQNPLQGTNLAESLRRYLTRLKRYALVSVLARVVAIILIFGYFLSAIPDWQSRHYWSLAGILVLMAVQVFWLYRIWQSRIRQVARGYREITEA